MPNYAAVAHPTSPFITIYDSTDWSKIPDPAVLPSSQGNAVALSPDGRFLAVGSQSLPFLAVYDTSDWSLVSGGAAQPDWTAYSLAFSPDSSKLVVGGRGAISLAVYDTSSWSKLPNPAFMPDSDVYGVAFSPTGGFFAAAGFSTYVAVYDASDISLQVVPYWPPESDSRAVDFSPDGTVMAVVGIDFSSGSGLPLLVLYETSGWSVIATPSLSTQPSAASDVAFSPDGSHLVVGINSGAIESFIVLRTSDWTQVPTTGNFGNCASIAYSTDGAVLAVGLEGGDNLRLHSTADWSVLPAPAVLPPNSGLGVAFTPATPTPPVIPPFWTQRVRAVETI